MTNQFDEKIMNFDVANGRDAFIELFTYEDISGMLRLMDNGSYGLHNGPQEMIRSIITAYVKEWLVEAIDYGPNSRTRQLFDIWGMVALGGAEDEVKGAD